MYYSAFLSLMNELTGCSKASITIDGRVVSMERVKETQWVFSTKLYGVEREAYSCFSSSGSFRFQQADISLQLNKDTIYALQKVQMPAKKYIPFKQHLTYFLEIVSQYEEMLTLQKNAF